MTCPYPNRLLRIAFFSVGVSPWLLCFSWTFVLPQQQRLCQNQQQQNHLFATTSTTALNEASSSEDFETDKNDETDTKIDSEVPKTESSKPKTSKQTQNSSVGRLRFCYERIGIPCPNENYLRETPPLEIARSLQTALSQKQEQPKYVLQMLDEQDYIAVLDAYMVAYRDAKRSNKNHNTDKLLQVVLGMKDVLDGMHFHDSCATAVEGLGLGSFLFDEEFGVEMDVNIQRTVDPYATILHMLLEMTLDETNPEMVAQWCRHSLEVLDSMESNPRFLSSLQNKEETQNVVVPPGNEKERLPKPARMALKNKAKNQAKYKDTVSDYDNHYFPKAMRTLQYNKVLKGLAYGTPQTRTAAVRLLDALSEMGEFGQSIPLEVDLDLGSARKNNEEEEDNGSNEEVNSGNYNNKETNSSSNDDLIVRLHMAPGATPVAKSFLTVLTSPSFSGPNGKKDKRRRKLMGAAMRLGVYEGHMEKSLQKAWGVEEVSRLTADLGSSQSYASGNSDSITEPY